MHHREWMNGASRRRTRNARFRARRADLDPYHIIKSFITKYFTRTLSFAAATLGTTCKMN